MCFGSLFDKKNKEKKESPSKITTKSNQKRTVKLVLCGNAAVGKTSITMRYKEGSFQKFH
jgi:GTPase SAR1 family protein